MALQIESLDSGSNYKFGDKLEIPNVPRSLFDKSHTVITTVENQGKLQVLNWINTLPNEDDDISVDSLLRCMPMVVPPYSKSRQYIYGFWNSLANLWDNFHVFATKGYSGTLTKYIPTFNDGNLAGIDTDVILPGSLGDQLGLPIGMTRAQLKNAQISCLSFMALLRIWRDYFVNKNYYMEDRIILPDDDSRFRVDDDGQLLSAKDLGYTFLIDLFSTSKGITRVDTAGSESITFHNFYHEYPKDRFTSAFPSTQRGNEETLPLNISIDSNTQSLFSGLGSSVSGIGTIDRLISTTYDSKSYLKAATESNNTYTALNQTSIDSFNNIFESWLSSHPISSVTVNDLRRAFINQRIMEKMAKTDGSFAEFALTLFGIKPRDAQDYRATYVGGTYKDIAFTEVLKTSQNFNSDGEAEGAPVGAYAGHGITGQNNNYLGHLKSDNYGILMFMTCIMPDVYYFQGIEKKHSLHIQDDLVTPERCKLGMIPILNKELFYQGDNGTSVGQDNYLWAYQDYADEYRYVENRISGKIADSTNESFFPFTTARSFANLPNWSKEFATADNVSKRSFAAKDLEDCFSLMVHFNIRSVLPIPYRAEPATLGI